MNILNDAEIRTLHEALDDEFRALATYDGVIETFGNVRPFTRIRNAEARHIEALCHLFAKYGIPVPENPWPGKVERFSSIEAACKAGVAAEVANGAMYERLLGTTTREEILAVLRNLRDASQQRHLPAFERCLQRGNNGRRGHRGGRGGPGCGQ